MNKLLSSNLSVAGFTITVPVIAMIYALAVWPRVPSVSFVVLTLVAMAATAVILNTWRNAQATENIGHVLCRTEAVDVPQPFVRPANDRRAPQVPQS